MFKESESIEDFEQALNSESNGVNNLDLDGDGEIDFNGCPFSSSIDVELTKVLDGNFIKVLSWYDNEWGFSNRMVDVARLIGST